MKFLIWSWFISQLMSLQKTFTVGCLQAASVQESDDFMKGHLYSIDISGHIFRLTGSILKLLKYKPNDVTFNSLRPLILRLLIKNFVAKWSRIWGFSDWLDFYLLLGNINEWAPLHKATFEHSVIRWHPLCLFNCSRLSARCMTPCHLQGSTSRSECVCVCVREFRKCLQNKLKTTILVFFCHFDIFIVLKKLVFMLSRPTI